MFSKPNIYKAVLIGLAQLIFLTAIFVLSYNRIKNMLAENRQTERAELSPTIDDVGLTRIDWKQVKKANPEPIKAGVYLDRIQEFDIVRSKWSYEFYAWFKWNPKRINFISLKDSAKDIDVQHAPIKIVNGAIEDIDLHSFYLNTARDSAYVLFHITGSTTKFFDVSQYPLDSYMLMIQLESVNRDIRTLAFVPDTVNSNVSSRVSVNGFEKDEHYILSKPHTIKSTLGDPLKLSSQHNTYSQLRFSLNIKRGGLGIYLKVFITLYIAALLGFLSFFAGETDKIRVIVGSLFFAAATLNIIISRIPPINDFCIAEIVNDISLVTILLIAGRETFIKYLLRHNHELNVLNKWITFSMTLIFYVVINIAIPIIVLKSIK